MCLDWFLVSYLLRFKGWLDYTHYKKYFVFWVVEELPYFIYVLSLLYSLDLLSGNMFVIYFIVFIYVDLANKYLFKLVGLDCSNSDMKVEMWILLPIAIAIFPLCCFKDVHSYKVIFYKCLYDIVCFYCNMFITLSTNSNIHSWNMCIWVDFRKALTNKL
jgi:hypothetical protein